MPQARKNIGHRLNKDVDSGMTSQAEAEAGAGRCDARLLPNRQSAGSERGAGSATICRPEGRPKLADSSHMGAHPVRPQPSGLQ